MIKFIIAASDDVPLICLLDFRREVPGQTKLTVFAITLHIAVDHVDQDGATENTLTLEDLIDLV